MKLIIYITFFSIITFLISCITGSINNFPDYKIAYIPIEYGASIFIMNSDGTDKTLLAGEDADHASYHFPFWDNNNDLYYIASRVWYFDKGFMWRDTLSRININTKRSDVIYGSESRIFNLISDGLNYAAFFDSGSLIIFDLRTKKARNISSVSMGSYSNLCWSTDPNKIILYKNVDPNTNIYTLDLTTSEISFLVTAENTRYLVASTNAAKVAYVSSDDHSISVLDLHSLNSEIIVEVESDKQLAISAWSPDNINLNYWEHDNSSNSYNMYLINSISKKASKLLSSERGFFGSRFFPDAMRLCISHKNSQDSFELLNYSLLTNEFIILSTDQQVDNPTFSISSNILF